MRVAPGVSTFFIVYLVCLTGFSDDDYRLLLESDENRASGSELFVANFDTYDDLLSGTLSSGSFSQLDIGANFSSGGLAFDGFDYHLLLESDDNRAGGSELFVAKFDTYDDLLSGTLSSGSFSQLDIGPNFSSGGLAYDGSGYQLLLESDENRAGGSELFVANFDTYDDLLNGTLSSGSFSQLDIGPNFSSGGLAFDGSDYQLLLESDENRAGGSELFLANFDTYDDLLSGSLSSGGFSQLDVGPNFSSGGLMFETRAVPEPSILAVMPLFCLLMLHRRRHHVN